MGFDELTSGLKDTVEKAGKDIQNLSNDILEKYKGKDCSDLGEAKDACLEAQKALKNDGIIPQVKNKY